jgi:ubiquitin C-terminal hydrolase
MDKLKKYCSSGKLKDMYKIDKDIASTMLKLVPIVLKKYPDINNFYHKRALQILELFYEPPPLGDEYKCKQLYGLSNIGSSCYLDSVLFALFAIPNKYIDENILYKELEYENKFFNCINNIDSSGLSLSELKQIDLDNKKKVQSMLRQIAESIRGSNTVKDCTDLRSAFKPCSSVDNFYEIGMKDPAEFLFFILKLFNIESHITTREKIVYTTTSNKNTYEMELEYNNPLLQVRDISIDRNENIVQLIDKEYLRRLDHKKEYYISKFITLIETEIPSEKTTILYTKKLFSSPYIIFYCNRINFEEETYNKMIESGVINIEELPIELNELKIIPSKTITIGNGSRFQLSAVVIWTNYHYTCYFKCGKVWFYYNDLDSNISYIGSYKKFLKSDPSPVTNGILYFYVPI